MSGETTTAVFACDECGEYALASEQVSLGQIHNCPRQGAFRLAGTMTTHADGAPFTVCHAPGARLGGALDALTAALARAEAAERNMAEVAAAFQHERTTREAAERTVAFREKQLRTIARFAACHHDQQDPAVWLHALTVDIPSLCSGHEWPCQHAEGAGDCDYGDCLPLDLTPPSPSTLAVRETGESTDE